MKAKLLLLLMLVLTLVLTSNATADCNCPCFSEGRGPDSVKVVISDINCGEYWKEGIHPSPPNGIYYLECWGTCTWYVALDNGLRIYYNPTSNELGASRFEISDWEKDFLVFFHWNSTPCATYFINSKNSPEGSIWYGGTADVDLIGDFNGDGIVNFEDYAILAKAPWSYQVLRRFAENWLLEMGQL
ncbi:hypothetical protein ES705_23403 [subsurface metagenome]